MPLNEVMTVAVVNELAPIHRWRAQAGARSCSFIGANRYSKNLPDLFSQFGRRKFRDVGIGTRAFYMGLVGGA